MLAQRKVPDLPSDRPPDRPATKPSVTVVVAARNEADRIRTTVSRLLAQTGVDLEVVVVNDRSDDETGPILDDLAAAEARLRVLHVDTLPDGWLPNP